MGRGAAQWESGTKTAIQREARVNGGRGREKGREIRREKQRERKGEMREQRDIKRLRLGEGRRGGTESQKAPPGGKPAPY